MRVKFLLTTVLFCLSWKNSSAQVKFFASGGMTYLQEKEYTFTRRLLDFSLDKAAEINRNFEGYMDFGMRIQKKKIRWVFSLGSSRYNYSYSPNFKTGLKPEKTKFSYWANSLCIQPSYLFLDKRLALGLGLEVQYITKPKIIHGGIGEHNIYDIQNFTKALLLSSTWDFKLLKKDFILGYYFSCYFTSNEALKVHLRYGEDLNNGFQHDFLFNTHTIKLSYVFN